MQNLAEEIKLPKLTKDEFDRVISPFKHDMIAVFQLIQEDVFKLVEQAENEGWTPEKLVSAVGQLI